MFLERLLKECFQKKANSKRKIPEISRSFDNFMRKMLNYFQIYGYFEFSNTVQNSRMLGINFLIFEKTFENFLSRSFGYLKEKESEMKKLLPKRWSSLSVNHEWSHMIRYDHKQFSYWSFIVVTIYRDLLLYTHRLSVLTTALLKHQCLSKLLVYMFCRRVVGFTSKILRKCDNFCIKI